MDNLLGPRNPAEPQPGERIGLGHAGRADAALIEVGHGGGRAVTDLIDAAINLVAKDPGSGLTGD
ncbi:hypothetical protein D3C72_2546290 [compost metagenome]